MEFWVVTYIHYGDDWQTEYKEVFNSEEEVKNFIKEHDEEMKNVNGVEHIGYAYEKQSEKQLRYSLSVVEYCELFPDVLKLIEDYHNRE